MPDDVLLIGYWPSGHSLHCKLNVGLVSQMYGALHFVHWYGGVAPI